MMKMVRPVLSLCLFVGTLAASAGDFVIATRGERPACEIVYAPGLGESYRHAAEELQSYTVRMTGVWLQIVRKPTGKKSRTIVLKPGSDELGEEGFRLQVRGDVLTVSGGIRGILYGVYEILERFGGCGWYASWHEVVPRRESFAVPDALDESQKPAFLGRNPSWRDVCRSAKFACRLRMNGRNARPGPELGGDAWRFNHALGSSHTFNKLLPPERYFKDHPEYFSEINGVRRDGRTQLCLSNPDVRRIVASNVVACVKSDPNCRIAGVSQNDWKNFCECKDCKALDDREGSPAGSMIDFVNFVAAELEKACPGRYVETLAYTYTRKPPKTLRPAKNVIPCLCSIECEFAHPMYESTFSRNRAFVQDLEGWSKLTDMLYFWDYTTNYDHYLHAMPNVYTLQPNIRYYREKGVKFLYEQGGGIHADFAELKAWLISKWLWDPDKPMKPLLDQFFAGYYGAAAPYVRAYFEDVHACVKDDLKKRVTIWEIAQPSNFPDEFLVRARAHWAKAREAVKDDPACLYNVKMGEAVTLCMQLDRLADDAKYVWVTRHPENFKSAEDARALYETLTGYLDEADRRGNHVDLGLDESRHYRTIDGWKRLLTVKRPAKGCDVVEVPVKDLQIKSPNYGRYVDDPSAYNGRAIEVYNIQEVETILLSFGHVAFDPGVPYRLRVHVRADRVPDGKGQAFRAVLYNLNGWREMMAVEKNVEDMADGYDWYEVGTFKPASSQVFRFCPGQFAKGGGRNAFKALYVDKIEISRAETK